MEADARLRWAIGLSVLAGTILPLHRDRIGRREQQTFRLVNDLPDRLYAPAWTVMQLGALPPLRPPPALPCWQATVRWPASWSAEGRRRGRWPRWSRDWCAGAGRPPCCRE